MIREAIPQDAIAVNQLAIEALSRDPYPELEIDKLKVYRYVMTCLNSKAHFSWVSVDRDDVVQGVLGVMVAPHAFYKYNQATVLMWYVRDGGKGCAGDGIRLMRRFLRWLSKKEGITLVERTAEKDENPAIEKQLQRMGFDKKLSVNFMLRGNQ